MKMEIVTELLRKAGFQRTTHPISTPLVVHAVAGAGKTTILKALLQSGFTVCSPALHAGNTLLGARVNELPSGEEFAVDEYLKFDTLPACQVVFADPCQYHTPALTAHYVSTVTHRLGRATTELLQRFLPITINSTKEDVVELQDLFVGEPQGQIIAIQEDVRELAIAHGLYPLRVCEAQGKEYPVVTVLSSQPLSEVPAHQLYIALSRHTEKLVVLCR
jgi:hypothetical protein